jgi:hypothetical protein
VAVNVGLCLRNAGTEFISMAMARCLVQGRKGQEFAHEFIYVQGLAPGEERLMTATAWVSEDVRTRRGAKLLVKVGSTELPVVVQVPAETCSVAPAEKEPDEDDELDDEDGDAVSGDEDEQPDEDGDDGTAAEGSRAADRGPVECVVICDEESFVVKVAAFYCESADDSTRWVYYVGDDKAGGFESGFMCLMPDDAQSDYEHFYLSVDGESFSQDVVTGKDVQVSLRPEDRVAFEALLKFCNSWVTFDENSETYTVQRKRRGELAENEEDSTQLEHYSSGIDLELLNVISANWAVQFQFSFE